MAFFKRKTPVFEAIQWLGDNFDEVRAFVGPTAFMLPSATQDGMPMTLAIREKDGFCEVRKGEWIYDSGDGFSTKHDDSIRNSYEQVQP